MTLNDSAARRAIAQGKAILGIELGSTRIKAVLIDADHAPLAVGPIVGKTSSSTAGGRIRWIRSGRVCRTVRVLFAVVGGGTGWG